jgi:hypothetical protein
MTARPRVRVRRARRSGPLACGHPAHIGEQIVHRGSGWICAACAVKLALDAITASQAGKPANGG